LTVRDVSFLQDKAALAERMAAATASAAERTFLTALAEELRLEIERRRADPGPRAQRA
jgi:hypothetical protein